MPLLFLISDSTRQQRCPTEQEATSATSTRKRRNHNSNHCHYHHKLSLRRWSALNVSSCLFLWGLLSVVGNQEGLLLAQAATSPPWGDADAATTTPWAPAAATPAKFPSSHGNNNNYNNHNNKNPWRLWPRRPVFPSLLPFQRSARGIVVPLALPTRVHDQTRGRSAVDTSSSNGPSEDGDNGYLHLWVPSEQGPSSSTSPTSSLRREQMDPALAHKILDTDLFKKEAIDEFIRYRLDSFRLPNLRQRFHEWREQRKKKKWQSLQSRAENVSPSWEPTATSSTSSSSLKSASSHDGGGGIAPWWLNALLAAGQAGLLFWLGYSLVKVILEAVEEVQQDGLVGGEASPCFPRNHVLQVVQYLEAVTDAIAPRGRPPHASSSAVPPLPTNNPLLLQLAHKLARSGLPLREDERAESRPPASWKTPPPPHLFWNDPSAQWSPPPTSSSSAKARTSARPTTLHYRPSIERVLSSLTRPETRLLQQCLWVPKIPPQRSRQHQRQASSSSLWNSLVGLDRAKQTMLAAVQKVQRTDPLYSSTPSLSSAAGYGEEDSLFDVNGSTSTTGVLMYGPPGCGKSLLIRALALHLQWPCLVVSPSVLLRKYVGETNQQCRALFSLARKLSPCILCIDEVDGLFRQRSGGHFEHEVSRDLKTEFMQHLDGMMSSAASMMDEDDYYLEVERISASSAHGQTPEGQEHPSYRRYRRSGKNLVVAATNRPFDVDPAIIRRLGHLCYVGLPNTTTRKLLIQHMLRTVAIDPENMNLASLAERTVGYSPSDLRQLLQTAVVTVMGERQRRSGSTRVLLQTADVLAAMQLCPATPLHPQYQTALVNFARATGGVPAFASTDVQNRNDSHMASAGDFSLPWQTEMGNFYNLGSLTIDAESFEALMNLAEELARLDFDDEDDLE